ncbi:MAG: hypothetical protein GY752_12240 [bacterium]|nr:hypothetical protein [bacterium]
MTLGYNLSIDKHPPGAHVPCECWFDYKELSIPFPEFSRNRWATCIHEASHTVVAMHFGIELYEAEVPPENTVMKVRGEDVVGAVTPKAAKEGPVNLPAELDQNDKCLEKSTKNSGYTFGFDEDPAKRRVSLEVATVFLAGYQGSMIDQGIEPDGYTLAPTSDHGAAIDALTESWGHGLHLLACQEWARRILINEWPAVLLIAKELEQKVRVPGYRLLSLYATGIHDSLNFKHALERGNLPVRCSCDKNE